MAFVIKADDAVLMLTQDELDSFVVSALPDPEQVPTSVADIVLAFLDDGSERTVSLRRKDIATPEDVTPLDVHVEADGSWQSGHLPLDEEGILTVSDISRDAVAERRRAPACGPRVPALPPAAPTACTRRNSPEPACPRGSGCGIEPCRALGASGAQPAAQVPVERVHPVDEVIPTASRASASTAATAGSTSVRPPTTSAATSSPVETTAFETGSGDTLTGGSRGGLRRMRTEGGRRTDHGHDDRCRRVRLAALEEPDRATGDRADHRMQLIPEGVEEGDLVGREVDQQQDRGDDQQVGALQDVRDLLEVEEAPGEPEQEGHEVGA